MPRSVSRSVSGLLALVLSASVAGEALAWGAHGHRVVGVAAMEALPSDVPAFLRSRQGVADVGELSREPDRWKGSGQPHASMRDPAHFVDLDGEGRVLGGPHVNELPDRFQAYEAALRAAGTDTFKAGWLPYAMTDGYQQLVTNFAYWRVLKVLARTERNATKRRWYARDLARREQLILRDLGEFSHYVADASQPHHTTIHYNGWDANTPNPNGYTRDRVHGPFEGEFVAENVTLDAVRAGMAPLQPCAETVWAKCAVRMITDANARVEPFYALHKEGGFQPADARGRAFATERLAHGASKLRDFTVDAWRASANARVGWPAIAVADVEAGRLTVDPWPSLNGSD